MKWKKEIDYENITPMEIFKKFPNFRKKILSLNILKLKNKENWKDLDLENLAWVEKEKIEIVIPEFKCIRRDKEKQASIWFPYFHQVFWFLLMELKDVWFAISELERISNQFFKFPNGIIVELDKRKNFNF